ncbi:MAG: bis(5'-nucleosyl)-tetraphosphatase (symmetrical) YqeK [Cyanobacteria bacterium J069]|nr:MAG: HD domain-containing protein [Cyanobacteria bacterium J069]
MTDLDSKLRDRVLAWLQTQVPEARVRHVLGVEELAIALAETHHLDRQRAALAALMHDLAKYFKPQTLLGMAGQSGLQLDPVDRADPHLLHADVGAIVARQEFGVRDEDVLAAIANHTLGQPGMSALSCVVFLADTLESGRGDTAELNQLRQVSQQNLTKAVWMTCDYTFKHLLDKGRLIHPRALQTRNWFLQADLGRWSSPAAAAQSLSLGLLPDAPHSA